MTHERTRIRAAITALLAAGGTTAGNRVHEEPTDARRVFPCLTVEDLGEQQRPSSMGGGIGSRAIERVLMLEVTAELQQNTHAAARDELIGQVEVLMANAAIPGVKDIQPAGFAAEKSALGEHPCVSARQRFIVVYITPQGDPTTHY